eukprot:10910261-Ditylum_brightwellii.AAC.1
MVACADQWGLACCPLPCAMGVRCREYVTPKLFCLCSESNAQQRWWHRVDKARVQQSINLGSMPEEGDFSAFTISTQHE